MRASSLEWKTIRKERAHVLERKSTGADRGPGGAGDWSKKWMGRILQPGCKGGSRNTNQSLEVAPRGEKRFQKRGSVAKTKLKGNASAENDV